MMNITELSTSQLNRIIAIKQQIETLESEMEAIATGSPASAPVSVAAKTGKRTMSPAARARIAAAARARWAKVKAGKPAAAAASAPVSKKRDGRRSPAVRAKLAAAAKARWAKAKAAGKSRL